MKVQTYFLFFRNLVNSTPMFLGDVTSPNNVVGFYGISNASNSQQPIEIDVSFMNLIHFPSIEKNPLDFPS